MLAYIMVTDGEMQVIPVDVDLKTFTHITVKSRRLGRSLLLNRVHYCLVHDMTVPVFILTEDEFKNGK